MELSAPVKGSCLNRAKQYTARWYDLHYSAYGSNVTLTWERLWSCLVFEVLHSVVSFSTSLSLLSLSLLSLIIPEELLSDCWEGIIWSRSLSLLFSVWQGFSITIWHSPENKLDAVHTAEVFHHPTETKTTHVTFGISACDCETLPKLRVQSLSSWASEIIDDFRIQHVIIAPWYLIGGSWVGYITWFGSSSIGRVSQSGLSLSENLKICR